MSYDSMPSGWAGKLLLRTFLPPDSTVLDFERMIDSELALKQQRLPYRSYKIHKLDHGEGKLPGYVLEHVEQDSSTPSPDVWELDVRTEKEPNGEIQFDVYLR